MTLEFATPLAALVGAAAVLPLAAAVARERTAARARRALRLAPPGRRARFASALAGAAVVACLATAAAQPRLRLGETVRMREDAQLYFVFDISRSMLARRDPHGETRLARAQALAIRVRNALPGVPAGVGSLTDWTLLHLPPSPDRTVFADVVRRAVAVDRPPPFGQERVATDFFTLADTATSPFFAKSARRRLVILLSDGESASFAVSTLVELLGARHVSLLVVRLWHPDEAIYLRAGVRDPRYRPEASSLGSIRRLAAKTAGGRVFGEGESGAVVAAARRILGTGPTRAFARDQRLVPLSSYVALAAALPLFLVFRLRDERRRRPTLLPRPFASPGCESAVRAPPARLP